MTDPVRASFDRIARLYAAEFADELTRKPDDVARLRRFASACPAGPVLDVGCGAAGHVGRFVADLGRPVLGVDLSEVSLTLARALNRGLAFVAGDARALPIATGRCAGVLAFYSLIYDDLPTTAGALREARRVLRAGGRLLVAVHGGQGVQRFTDYQGIAIEVDLHLRDPDAFAAAVTGAGFAVEALEVRAPYPFEHPTERVYVSGRAG